MISVPVRNIDGTEAGSYELDPADLAASVNRQLLHDVVVMHEANRRVGTVRTKSRGMVQGSTKKLYRQKGTGRARAGSIRTNVRRGGGHAFGKVPVDHGYRLPRKAIRLATRMALLSKFQDDEATVLSELSASEPKTSYIANALKALGVNNSTSLLVIDGHDPVLWKSARNIPNLKVSPAAELNAYDLLHQKNLLITRAAIDSLRNTQPEAAAS